MPQPFEYHHIHTLYENIKEPSNKMKSILKKENIYGIRVSGKY